MNIQLQEPLEVKIPPSCRQSGVVLRFLGMGVDQAKMRLKVEEGNTEIFIPPEALQSSPSPPRLVSIN